MLFIKLESGRLIELNLNPDVEIQRLKEILEYVTKIPVHAQILSINNQLLRDGQLYHYLIPMYKQIAPKINIIPDRPNPQKMSDMEYIQAEQIYIQAVQQQRNEVQEFVKRLSNETIVIEMQEFKEKLKIFVATEKRCAEFDVEPHQQIGFIKKQLEKMWGIPVKQQSLRIDGKLLYDHKSFQNYDLRSGELLEFSLKPQQYHFQTQDGHSVLVTQLNSVSDIDASNSLKKKNPNDIIIQINPKL